jgi:Uma2 family endonuclease
MDVVRQQVTADELLLMPDDGFRYELVHGELRRMNPAGNVHGRVTMRFAWRLAQYVEETILVPCTPLRQDSGSLPIPTPCVHRMWLS